MADPPRNTEQRIADALAKLTTTVDCWVPSAGPNGEVYLIPLSFVWHDEQLTIATPAASRTARNLRRAGQARVAVGETRDVVIIDGTLTFIPKDEVAPALADAFSTAAGFDPRRASGEYLYITLTPRSIQTWRNVGELAGREIMRDGEWQA